MNLIRRFISVFFIAVLIAGLIYSYLWFKTKSNQNTEAWLAVPENAVFFMETTDFCQLAADLKNHNDIWNEFMSYEIIDQLDAQLNEIDSLARSFPDFRAILETPAVISLNRIGNNYRLLYVLSPERKKATQEILKLISNEAGIDKRKYQNQTIYELDFKNKKLIDKLSFAETKGLLLLSSSTEMTEKAIMNLDHHRDHERDERFEKLRATTGKDAVANIYVNYKELSIFLQSIFSSGNTGHLASFAEWSAMDLDIKPKHLILNGFTTTSDSFPQQLSLLKDQDAVNFEITSVIPAGAVFFKLAGFNDPARLQSAIEDYIPEEELEKKRKILNAGYTGDFTADFSKLLNNEAGEVIVRNADKYEKYFIARLKASGLTESLFAEWLQEFAEGSGINYSNYKNEVPIDNQNKAIIYQSPVEDIPALLFPGLFSGNGYRYFSFVNNYLVFGSSESAVKEFLYQNILGKTLDNDEFYNKLNNNLASRSNLFVFLNPSLYFEKILKFLDEKATESVMKTPDDWKKITALSFQSTSSGSMHYFHLFLNYSGNIREFVNTVWESKLDTTASFKPAIVRNHDTNDKEIFLQDDAANIYLISNSGSIIWKQKIDGIILGDIHQIDYYRNGKLQYLFNTKDKIYLIDRNGNPVERYPVRLREQASAGLSVFDYDMDGTLRICLPAENRDIYMYDREGNFISGWRFKKADFPVQHPVQHVRLGERDFIIAGDKRELHILNRRGNPRVIPEKQIEFSSNNPPYPENLSKSDPHISCTDTSGAVYHFLFDGSVKKIFDPGLSSGHFFIPSDLNGDGAKDYVFTDKNRLLVYSENGNLQFDEELPAEINLKPVIYEFSATDKKIGIVAGELGRIYLFNNNGSIYQGFPLNGSYLFSISSFPGLNARFNLIVSNDDNFLYNYSVK